MANKYKLKFTLSDGNTIDAGEIVVPEGAKGDKGDKGDPYTLTSTDKAAIVQDVLAALPYYDGSVDISGGVELISFTIAGTSYQAEEGMTWEEWCDSEYNTGNVGVTTSGDVYLGNATKLISTDGTYSNRIKSTSVIIAGQTYVIYLNSGAD